MQKHGVQDSGSFVGELVDELQRRNLDQLGRGRPVDLDECQCPFWWWHALTSSVKWSNEAFPFQNIAPEVPSPDDSPSPKPCVPRCLWPGPPLGHQSLPADVRGQYMSGHCSGISQRGLPMPLLVWPAWLMVLRGLLHFWMKSVGVFFTWTSADSLGWWWLC